MLAPTAGRGARGADAVQQHALSADVGVWAMCATRRPRLLTCVAVHPHGDGPLVWFGVHDAPLPMKIPGPRTNSTRPARCPARALARRYGPTPSMLPWPNCQAIAGARSTRPTSPPASKANCRPPRWRCSRPCARPARRLCRLHRTSEEQVLSASPELFFDWHDGHLITPAHEGTGPAPTTHCRRCCLADGLRTSPKRAENVMIVDLIRNDLSRIAWLIRCRWTACAACRPLPTVWQMVSDVRADTRPGTTLADVFGALFPADRSPARPKVQAMRLIRALETRRAAYCGAVGVVRRRQRHLQRAHPHRAGAGRRLWAGTGSGITWDATAQAEWQEWRHKADLLQRASQGFELLETLALEDGVLPKMDAHLARMAVLPHFGFAWDAQAARGAGRPVPPAPLGSWRVRLLLNASGQLQAQAFAQAPTPPPCACSWHRKR